MWIDVKEIEKKKIKRDIERIFNKNSVQSSVASGFFKSWFWLLDYGIKDQMGEANKSRKIKAQYMTTIKKII